jgi:hypothetical protein
MAVETNTILTEDIARVRAIDFNMQFTGSLKKFMEAMGVTRKIAVQEGTTLKALKVTGTLENGTVAVRTRKAVDLGAMPVDDSVARVVMENATKARD